MRHAPSLFVLGSIAYRGDHGRVFRRADAAQYAAGRRFVHRSRSGQPGRDRQTAKFAETIKTCTTATGEIAAPAAGRTTRSAGASAAAFGKTQAETQAETKTKTQGKTKTSAQSCAKAAGSARTGRAEAKAKTEEAG